MATLQARAGIARSAAARSGYFTPNVVVTIDGSDRTSSIVQDSLRLSLKLNDDIDTASFTLNPSAGFIPTASQAVIVGLGSASNRQFAGQIVRVSTTRQASPSGILRHTRVQCVDWLRLFDRRVITTEYSSLSASAIASDLIANWTSGFTSGSVEANLPTVDYFPLTNESPSRAMTRLVALMGGGGWFIGADRDVHLFGPAGDLSAKAPTAPITLTDTLSTLKSFSQEEDGSQLRTRVFTEGRGTTCPIQVPAFATSFPVSDGVPLSDGADILRIGTQRLTTFNVWALSPASYLALGNIANAQSSVIHAAATTGATSIQIDTFSGGIQAAGWLKVNDQYVYYGSTDLVTGAGFYYIFQNIPASGYGSLPIDIAVGDRVSVADMIDGIPASGAGAILATQPPNSAVVLVEQVDDGTAQTAVAAIEGDGDGIHEHVIQDGRLSRTGAAARGQADLDAFATATGLTTIQWTTQDMRAMPGAPQAIDLTGVDGLNTTLTITSVEMTFPKQNYVPTRRCEAAPVRPADFSEIAATERI